MLQSVLPKQSLDKPLNFLSEKRRPTTTSVCILCILYVRTGQMVIESETSEKPTQWARTLGPTNYVLGNFLRDALVIWLTTSSWSHIHLEFEGGC